MSEPRYSDKVLAALQEIQSQYNASPKMSHEEMVEAMCRAIELGKRVERQRVLAIIKQAQLEAMTGNGGYTRAVAEAFGQSWPLEAGWKKKLADRINEVDDES